MGGQGTGLWVCIRVYVCKNRLAVECAPQVSELALGHGDLLALLLLAEEGEFGGRSAQGAMFQPTEQAGLQGAGRGRRPTRTPGEPAAECKRKQMQLGQSHLQGGLGLGRVGDRQVCFW